MNVFKPPIDPYFFNVYALQIILQNTISGHQGH